MNDSVASYLAFLLAEMKVDAAVLDTPWVYCTVVPFLLYAVYMGIKWYLLLAPLTFPLTLVFVKKTPSSFLWKKGTN